MTHPVAPASTAAVPVEAKRSVFAAIADLWYAIHELWRFVRGEPWID